LQHHAERRILHSVALADLEKNGARTKPRAKKEDRDLSQWPKGTPQKLTKLMASRLFSLISTSENSMAGLLKEHPEFPPYRDLPRWRRTTLFAAEWKTAKQHQADGLCKALNPQKRHQRDGASLSSEIRHR
jgi:hypothetical protein